MAQVYEVHNRTERSTGECTCDIERAFGIELLI